MAGLFWWEANMSERAELVALIRKSKLLQQPKLLEGVPPEAWYALLIVIIVVLSLIAWGKTVWRK